MPTVSNDASPETLAAAFVGAFTKAQESGPMARTLVCCSTLATITIFVLSILAVSGAISGVAFGACLLGYAGLSVLSASVERGPSLGYGVLALMALGIIVGSLGVAGVASGFTSGWIILGMSIGCCPYYGSGLSGMSAAIAQGQN
jgi:hypothetical protein